MEYAQCTKRSKKTAISRELVSQWRSQIPPGRFLEKDEAGCWYEIDDRIARRKTAQLLREHPNPAFLEDEDGQSEGEESKDWLYDGSNGSFGIPHDFKPETSLKSTPAASLSISETTAMSSSKKQARSANSKHSSINPKGSKGFGKVCPGAAFVQTNKSLVHHQLEAVWDSESTIPFSFSSFERPCELDAASATKRRKHSSCDYKKERVEKSTKRRKDRTQGTGEPGPGRPNSTGQW